LSEGKRLGLRSALVFRAIAGYDHESEINDPLAVPFFELANPLTTKVEFVVSREEATLFLSHVQALGLSLFFTLTRIEHGRTDVIGEVFDKNR
jgi:PII-like signaling protein